MRIAPGSPGMPPALPAPRTAAARKAFTAVLDERAWGAPSGGPPGASSTAPSRPAPAATSSKRPAPPAAGARPAPSITTSPVRAMLERTMRAEKQVDALLEAAARGKTFTPAQLLAMQATVAGYSQTIEVVSRLTDRLLGAVRQTMGTQV